MPRLEVPATKSTLIRLRTELAFAREGLDLLERKKTVLISELSSVIASARAAETEIRDGLSSAFVSLREAVVKGGLRETEEAAAKVNLDARVRIGFRKMMGVSLVTVQTALPPAGLHYGLIRTDFRVDEAAGRFRKVLDRIADLARLRISLKRLALEIKKTVRRVNALEKIHIPNYSETLAYVADRIEEFERENFAMLKVLKRRKEK